MIGLLGLNHKSAPIEIREKFVFCEEDIKRFVPMLQDKGFKGVLVLSTCNRTEIYFETEDCEKSYGQFEVLKETLMQYRSVNFPTNDYFYSKEDKEVFTHLFTVASGLDSMAFGEYQIVGQLKNAFYISEKYKFFSSNLIRLFNYAFNTSKSVRTNTLINKGAVSISYAGVELAGKIFDNLVERPILLVGAGQTGELTLLNMKKRGCNKFTVVNRTYTKAVEMAKKYNGKSGQMENIEELLLANDIVISSTSSKKPIFNKSMVSNIMKLRNNKPLFFVDLSVPRNVEAGISDIPNVYVYDIDALNGVVESNIQTRKKEIDKANDIISDQVNRFQNWLNAQTFVPVIQNITKNLNKIHQYELKGFEKKNNSFDIETLSEFGNKVTDKLLRTVIKNARNLTNDGQNPEYVKLVNDLFTVN